MARVAGAETKRTAATKIANFSRKLRFNGHSPRGPHLREEWPEGFGRPTAPLSLQSACVPQQPAVQWMPARPLPAPEQSDAPKPAHGRVPYSIAGCAARGGGR